METQILRAESRTVLGKKVKRLRREGRVPGVVYGPVVDGAIAVSVDRREFDKFYQATGHSTLFTLVWDGGEQPVFIREVQQNPVKRAPVHIDFFAPNLHKELNAMVALVLHHPNPQADGILNHVHNEIEVHGLPSAIPHQIDVDISGLRAVGDAIRVSDLTLPEGITVVTHADEVLVALSADTVAQAAEEQAAELAEAVAEAAEAEAPVEADEAADAGEAAEAAGAADREDTAS